MSVASCQCGKGCSALYAKRPGFAVRDPREKFGQQSGDASHTVLEVFPAFNFSGVGRSVWSRARSEEWAAGIEGSNGARRRRTDRRGAAGRKQ